MIHKETQQINSTILAIIISIALVGCVWVPEVPPIEHNSIKKVGVFVGHVGYPTHTYIGGTVFNNKVKEQELDWDLRSEFTNVINNELKAGGFEFFDLEEAGYTMADFPIAMVTNEGGYVPANEETRKRLRDDDVDATITVIELDRIIGQKACSSFGCVDQWAEGYGVYSRSLFGIGHASAIFAFDFRAEIIDPIVVVSGSKEMANFSRWQDFIAMLDPAPEEFKNIDQATWDRVKAQLIEMLKERVSAVTEILAGS